MSAGITKECFPHANRCHNCDKKEREDMLENPEGRKEFKRCSGCHLLTYCDRDCQTQHWQKVHKRHCGFLSGQKLVKNSQHRKENCSLCLEERKARDSEISSITSPKTCCHIEILMAFMKERLGQVFQFHKGKKRCKCSMEFACQLPFPLEEVSGNYLGNGLDEMVAHALKIINAMGTKDKTEPLDQLCMSLIRFRVINWSFILQCGVEANQDDKSTKLHLFKLLEKLQVHYGGNNPWFKALLFSVNMVVEINTQLGSQFLDCSNLDDPKMSNAFKNLVNFQMYQLKNQDIVTRNNLWAVFKLWPVQADGGLKLLMPDGTRCHNCNSPITAQFSVMDHKSLNKQMGLPVLMSRFGENGQLMIVCSREKCLKETLKKDVPYAAASNKVLLKKLVEDQKLFFAKARVCDFCLKKSYSSHRCFECRASQYCSTQCQGEDLTFHQTVCSTWAKDKLRKIAGAKHQQKKSKLHVDKYFKQ